MTSEICVYCKAKCNCRYFNQPCIKPQTSKICAECGHPKECHVGMCGDETGYCVEPQCKCKKFKPSSKDDDNLSSKIHWITGTKDKKLLMVRVEEIQKAVQKLKEVVFNAYPEENTGKCCIKIRDEIDRIFGDFK